MQAAAALKRANAELRRQELIAKGAQPLWLTKPDDRRDASAGDFCLPRAPHCHAEARWCVWQQRCESLA